MPRAREVCATARTLLDSASMHLPRRAWLCSWAFLVVVLAACGGATSHGGSDGTGSPPGSDGGGTADASQPSTPNPTGETHTPDGRTCWQECFRNVRCRKGGCEGPVVSDGCCSCLPGEIDDYMCASDASADAPEGG